MRYNKEEKFLEASGNILITNQIENIEIISDKITYDKNEEKIVSSGNVEIKIENNYRLKTKKIIYLKNSEEILINDSSEKKFGKKAKCKIIDQKKSFLQRRLSTSLLDTDSILQKIEEKAYWSRYGL